jgi:hypothetical protein
LPERATRLSAQPSLPVAVLSTLALASRDGFVAYQRPAHSITTIAAEKTQSILLVGQVGKNLEHCEEGRRDLGVVR